MDQISLRIGLLGTIGMILVGCSPFKAGKTDFLKKQSVFYTETPTYQPPSSTPTPNPSLVPTPNPNPTPDKNPPAHFLCSSHATAAGSSVLHAQSVQLTLRDPHNDSIVCNVSVGVKEALLTQKSIPVHLCGSSLAGKVFGMAIRDTSLGSGNLAMIGSYPSSAEVVIYRETPSSQFKATTSPLRDASYAVDNGGQLETSATVTVLYKTDKDPDSQCDQFASPLVVDMRANATPGSISLTSQLDGILFDILGDNSFPVAHSPRQISWFKQSTNMFVAKPNAAGRVEGINELFGDNTRGPDGKFAANGYLALKKYDKNDDDLIDSADSVFSQLRLWSDANLDGKSTGSELFSLIALGVESIDLKYDASFSERDKYGNSTELKSVVNMKDGSFRLLFDLWFKYL